LERLLVRGDCVIDSAQTLQRSSTSRVRLGPCWLQGNTTVSIHQGLLVLARRHVGSGAIAQQRSVLTVQRESITVKLCGPSEILVRKRLVPLRLEFVYAGRHAYRSP